MKTKYLSLLIILSIVSCSHMTREEQLLRRALAKLESIETVEYQEICTAYMPGDTLYKKWWTRNIKAYNNPQDTTVGVNHISMQVEGDSERFLSSYDGNIYAVSHPDHKAIVLDDFTTRNLPFRPMTPPLFRYAENIVEYTLTTTDSIVMSVTESSDIYHLDLTIHEEDQVEFFGRAYHMPKLPESMRATHDPTSHYEIWFDKSTDLPIKIYREMCSNVSEKMSRNVKINTLSLDDFDMESYYPEGYEIIMRGSKNKSKSLTTADLVGKAAPDFELMSCKGDVVALKNIKSRAILLNFTGIGCGPCAQALPFLNKLNDKYDDDDLQIISIECWGKRASSLQHYANVHDIEYPFLVGEESVTKAYHASGVPQFVLLDSSHRVVSTYSGYTLPTSDEPIEELIKQVLDSAGK